MSARLAWWTFVAFLIAAFFLVLFRLGSYRWFHRDDFEFLAAREATSLDDLFRPANNSHWTTVPLLAFRALWAVFGLRSYLPYQAAVLTLHLSACVLLRVIMRRAGVGPWIATAAASAFVLFGPGWGNIIWAFQITYTGSLVFGLVQIVLGDHDGPVDWRDGLGIAAGFLALMSSGAGVTMVAIAALAMLLRRGWRVALLHSAPLAAAFLVWSFVEHPQLSSAFGRPTIDVVFRWVRSGEIGTFMALGHFEIVAVLLGVVLAIGLPLAWSGSSMSSLRRRAALPAALLVGSVLFSVSTAMGRWFYGSDYARASRFIHIIAALVLPAVAVAADAISRRWRPLTPILIGLFVIAIPWNAGEFDTTPFGPQMAQRKQILTNIVRLPEARQVPRDVRPISDVFLGSGVTIGFLLDAEEDGKLSVPSRPIPPALRDELRVRLGVAQRQRPLPPALEDAFGAAAFSVQPRPALPSSCRVVTGELELSPKRGTTLWIPQPVTIAIRNRSQRSSPGVTFKPGDGRQLTVELDGLDLRLTPPPGATQFTLCN